MSDPERIRRVRYAADCAERVLPIAGKARHQAEEAIRAARAWADEPTEARRIAAKDAAVAVSAAAEAAYAATAAAYTAAYEADAAADAAAAHAADAAADAALSAERAWHAVSAPEPTRAGAMVEGDRRKRELAVAWEDYGRAWDAWSAVVAGEASGDSAALWQTLAGCRARIVELGGGPA